MSKSPGHRKWPDHKVLEKGLAQKVKVDVGGEVIAVEQLIRVDELERSSTTTECPFKGTAHYFSLNAGGRKFADAVWTYEDPYEEHLGLKDRLAFYDDKIGEIRIEPRA